MYLSLHAFVSVSSRAAVLACAFRREEREKTGTRVEDGQALMDGGTLSGAKCNLTAEFNDIYFQATRFQTCSGSVLPAGPRLSTMPQAWREFTRNVCEWGVFTACLMSVRMK